MAKIIWQEDGQGKFDFDYLLNITNPEFVSVVRDVVQSDSVKAIKVEDFEKFVYVTIVGSVCSYKFYYYKDIDFFESHKFFHHDLDWVWSVLHG